MIPGVQPSTMRERYLVTVQAEAFGVTDGRIGHHAVDVGLQTSANGFLDVLSHLGTQGIVGAQHCADR